ncbi:hypothetical protein SDC9_208852 [bioreactor metagenome]|uniref:Uncharacterized protein n=1 Tax=bioreactor metagenome TaxID=1076179 RepID=A0A645JBQ1_9ZZZZ
MPGIDRDDRAADHLRQVTPVVDGESDDAAGAGCDLHVDVHSEQHRGKSGDQHRNDVVDVEELDE